MLQMIIQPQIIRLEGSIMKLEKDKMVKTVIVKVQPNDNRNEDDSAIVAGGSKS